MKHLKKINELKKNTPEEAKIDEKNSDEIRDLFLELKDLGCVLTIVIDHRIEESYKLKYYLENNIGFNVDLQNYNNSFEEEIQKNKQNLERLNHHMNLSHDFMERLKSVGYRIAWFNPELTWIGNNKVIETTIQINK